MSKRHFADSFRIEKNAQRKIALGILCAKLTRNALLRSDPWTCAILGSERSPFSRWHAPKRVPQYPSTWTFPALGQTVQVPVRPTLHLCEAASPMTRHARLGLDREHAYQGAHMSPERFSMPPCRSPKSRYVLNTAGTGDGNCGVLSCLSRTAQTSNDTHTERR